jgi:hypothetical protein
MRKRGLTALLGLAALAAVLALTGGAGASKKALVRSLAGGSVQHERDDERRRALRLRRRGSRPARRGEFPLAGALSTDPSPDLLDISPAGDLAFVSLRGALPLSGDAHASTGNTPGLGLIRVRKEGRTGALTGIARIANVDAGGIDRADPHGLRVRPK